MASKYGIALNPKYGQDICIHIDDSVPLCNAVQKAQPSEEEPGSNDFLVTSQPKQV